MLMRSIFKLLMEMMLMRFIINFFIFGFIFYAIWYFFPGAFATLVSWATAVFDFVKNIFQGISEKRNIRLRLRIRP